MDGQKIPERKFDLFLITILIIGLAVFITELYFALQSSSLGSRTAEYGALADNLLKGKGFVLDYIDQYYVKFDSIPHPLEWDYPMMGVLIAPFMALLGKTALAAKLPTMIIGTIFFPILTYYLGKEFFDRKIGFLAAISVLFYSHALELTYSGQRDTAFAFFALAGVYFFYKGLKEEKMKYFYLMGFFLGVSYLIRGATLIIIPALILAYYLIKKRIDIKFINGMLFAVLIVSPWLMRNYLIFGDPLFTANKYAQWVASWFTDYDVFGYEVYWHKAKPSFSWLLSLPIKPSIKIFVITKILNNFATQMEELLVLTTATFIGLLSISKEKIGKNLLIAFAFVIIFSITMDKFLNYALNILTIYMPFPLFPYLMIIAIANLKLAKSDMRIRIFALLWLAFALFHGAIVLQGGIRFMLVLIPFLFIFSWKAAEWILEFAQRNVKIPQQLTIGKMLAIILLTFILVNIALTYKASLKEESENFMPALINRATESDAIIMACNVQSLNFLTGRKFVEFPGDRIERFVEVIDTYNVSYITFFGCGQRTIYPKVAEAVFGQSTIPEDSKGLLYKISLELAEEEPDTIIKLNPRLVAGIDKNGKKFWTTDYLSE